MAEETYFMYKCPCGAKFSDSVLRKTRVHRKGYFCPACGNRKDMRTWKEWKETDMSNYDKPKTKKKIYIPGVRI